MNGAQSTASDQESGRRRVAPTTTPSPRGRERAPAILTPTGTYALHHDGRQIALRSVRHDHAALEALQLLGARLISTRPRRAAIGPEVPLTVYALARQLNLSHRRLQSFSSLPRPVSPDYLAMMRIPDRLRSAEHRLGDRRVPFLVYVAKVLNADDGRLRPHHEWMQCESETVQRLLATPPVEWGG